MLIDHITTVISNDLSSIFQIGFLSSSSFKERKVAYSNLCSVSRADGVTRYLLKSVSLVLLALLGSSVFTLCSRKWSGLLALE